MNALLLTGGTGFFGKSLLRHWIEEARRGNRPPAVTVLSRDPSAFLGRHPEFSKQEWLHFHEGDILQPSTLPAYLGYTHILHGAADSTFGPRLTPLERYVQIMDGTRNMLDYAVAHRIPRFLLTSSGSVYGPQPPDMRTMPEDYNGMPNPLDPQQAYSVAKRCAEHLCVLYQDAHGVETVIARCFAFVGQDLPLDAHFAIGNFIRDAMHAPEITVNGDGTPVRSYMDQRDLACWLLALLSRGQAGQAYNIGSDTAITIQELAVLVRDTLAPSKPIQVMGKPDSRNIFRNRYIPSIARARTELGLDLRYLLTESIKESVRHLSAQD
ncbi:NAD(P)-dependent oxidoreductase [Bordetella sp. FB-8]|uniref:NAD-dependent epimerase/dehydratase family protein n=1 Tax=Bordetella sp. FB-8 TaxID=1159870 RepID=UPI00036B34B1|nr:NAD(P)-dependent oxidoreductase [Bordetella sp. FB-8]